MPPHLPRPSHLSTFLRTRRTLLSVPSHPIVIGNPSGDLDSIISSLLYSYLHPSHPSPILQFPSTDLSLRPELLHLLSLIPISPSTDLLFAPDHNLQGRKIHLVDHNTPAGYLASLPTPPVIAGIIDHHDDEGQALMANPRVIKKAGSCTSLIVGHFWEAAEGLRPDEKRELARLALGAVLVDTSCMRKRVEKCDEDAMEMLEAWLLDEDAGELVEPWDRELFWKELVEAKEGVEGLGTRDLLRKDYKEWDEKVGKVGISSVVKGLEWLVGRDEDFLEVLRSWGVERGLDLVVVMTTLGTGDGEEFKRELLVWGVNEKGEEMLKEVERKAEDAGLKLEPWGEGKLDEEGKRKVWWQRNVEASRKQVAPFLRQCIQEVGQQKASKAKV